MFARCRSPEDSDAVPVTTALSLSKNIQLSTGTGNVRGVYDGIEKAADPTLVKTAPINESCNWCHHIKTKEKQMDTWVEHFSLLYSQENIILMQR